MLDAARGTGDSVGPQSQRVGVDGESLEGHVIRGCREDLVDHTGGYEVAVAVLERAISLCELAGRHDHGCCEPCIATEHQEDAKRC